MKRWHEILNHGILFRREEVLDLDFLSGTLEQRTQTVIISQFLSI